MVHDYSEAPVVGRGRRLVPRSAGCGESWTSCAPSSAAGDRPGGEARLLVFHGSPALAHGEPAGHHAARRAGRALAGASATVMAGGHTHVQMLRQHRGALLVNPGSVGMPFREFVNGRAPTLLPHAEYATVEAARGEVTVSLHRVALDQAPAASVTVRQRQPPGPRVDAGVGLRVSPPSPPWPRRPEGFVADSSPPPGRVRAARLDSANKISTDRTWPRGERQS
jgi:hypothetical protein